MQIKKILVSLFFAVLLAPSNFFAQDLLASGSNFGFNAGLNLAFGTHFQRLGVNLNFYVVADFFQANTEVRAYYNFKSLGPKLRYPELVISQGVLFGYSTRTSNRNEFMSVISNQTAYLSSFAYAYNIYLNKRKTSQLTGTVAFQFNRVTFIADNDLLAKPALDRFRTGAFLLQYQHDNIFQAAVSTALWTGKMGEKYGIINPKFFYQCYMDTTKGVYTNTSHGLLSAQFKYNLGYSQVAQANLGIDAEQIRNVIQNQIIHDMRFIPKKFNKAKNCHIPMLDENGNQYLYKEDQKIRKARPYFNLFTNASLFY